MGSVCGLVVGRELPVLYGPYLRGGAMAADPSPMKLGMHVLDCMI